MSTLMIKRAELGLDVKILAFFFNVSMRGVVAVQKLWAIVSSGYKRLQAFSL
jgi:hypothetical protein